jgi:hypothetical protein
MDFKRGSRRNLLSLRDGESAADHYDGFRLAKHVCISATAGRSCPSAFGQLRQRKCPPKREIAAVRGVKFRGLSADLNA